MARLAFPFLAACFGVAAAFHAVALFAPIDRSSPGWRHALFVAVNLAMAVGILRRPRWFVGVFAVFVVQQLWSHGRAFVERARAGGFDAGSALVLLGLPLVLALLVAEARSTAG